MLDAAAMGSLEGGESWAMMDARRIERRRDELTVRPSWVFDCKRQADYPITPTRRHPQNIIPQFNITTPTILTRGEKRKKPFCTSTQCGSVQTGIL